MRARLQNYLITGLLVVLPLAVTYLVLRWLFTTLDNVLQPFFRLALGWRIPGLGLIAGIVVILLAGMVASRSLGRRLIEFFEGFVLRIPVARWIYGLTKQLSDGVLRAEESGPRGAFKRVVLIEWPRKGLFAIGFVTGGAEHSPRLLHVFVPGTPNPTGGFTVVAAEDEVQPLALTVEEALQFIISYGIAGTPAAVERLLARTPSSPAIPERTR